MANRLVKMCLLVRYDFVSHFSLSMSCGRASGTLLRVVEATLRCARRVLAAANGGSDPEHVARRTQTHAYYSPPPPPPPHTTIPMRNAKKFTTPTAPSRRRRRSSVSIATCNLPTPSSTKVGGGCGKFRLSSCST